ncbi:hypothetical protein D3H64_05555 [Atopobacter sp. AH10]|uniref:endolytic transglycosylase MltG n=1 Tax=Atopobacter sp. AH10 TaxID=2315861 RepID=UPI000EF1CAA6|nr:endolytic transglycosylase MltG [Atopobacter sp. AH10]RLK63250.1 hypothetical protein D3H64_05555 [Atopobacter sp. AH10]
MKTVFRSIGIGFLLAAMVIAALFFGKSYLPEPIARFINTDSGQSSQQYQALKKEYEDYKKNAEHEIALLKEQSDKKKDGTSDKKDDSSSKAKGLNEDGSFTINEGEASSSVISRMAEAKLLDDASVFTNYMQSNGLDGKILPGTYKLSNEMSYEQIGAIITGQQ